MNSIPVYVSESTVRSIWQEYRIFDKSEGHIHRILLTPDNPEKFKSMLDPALVRYGQDS